MNTTTDQDVYSHVQMALIEPPNGGQSWPSGLWSREEVQAISNQRQDRFLFETLLLVHFSNTISIPTGTTRFPLPADWLRTVSIVWQINGNNASIRELPRADTFETDHAIPTWEAVQADHALVYDEFETPNLQAQIAPVLNLNGQVTVAYVPTGPKLDGTGKILLLPNELEHAIRYGILADLLSKDGRGHDPARAQYCEDRFDLAIELTRIILKGWP